ncbi:hypothetical protein VKT23_015599 [Stygiomarasmius scandens]|uniref:SWIM-type domain-containing protein n=1 Tax=Marasmiellus scandens TaxID=2682957 RepID=A0ABR1J0A2_9AGAR
MPITTTHNITHLLDLANNISLTNSLANKNIHGWLQYEEHLEAAFVQIISAADSDILEAPQCIEYPNLWHKVTVSLDPGDRLGSLRRINEANSDCDCPSILFEVDQDHARCIHAALCALNYRCAQELANEALQEKVRTNSELSTHTSNSELSTHTSNSNSTLCARKRVHTDSLDEGVVDYKQAKTPARNLASKALKYRWR